jgi:hypothetical protein
MSTVPDKIPMLEQKLHGRGFWQKIQRIFIWEGRS